MTIQINIGTIQVTQDLLKSLQEKLETMNIDKSLQESLSQVTAESIIDVLRERIACLENRLDTQDEPLRDIINEVTQQKPNLNKDLDNIKKQLDAAELEEVIIQKS
jgi:uncharacterized coiled-coil protein SlyX